MKKKTPQNLLYMILNSLFRTIVWHVKSSIQNDSFTITGNENKEKFAVFHLYSDACSEKHLFQLKTHAFIFLKLSIRVHHSVKNRFQILIRWFWWLCCQCDQYWSRTPCSPLCQRKNTTEMSLMPKYNAIQCCKMVK